MAQFLQSGQLIHAFAEFNFTCVGLPIWSSRWAAGWPRHALHEVMHGTHGVGKSSPFGELSSVVPRSIVRFFSVRAVGFSGAKWPAPQFCQEPSRAHDARLIYVFVCLCLFRLLTFFSSFIILESRVHALLVRWRARLPVQLRPGICPFELLLTHVQWPLFFSLCMRVAQSSVGPRELCR